MGDRPTTPSAAAAAAGQTTTGFRNSRYTISGGKPTFIVHFPGVLGPFSSTGDLIPLVQISRLNRLTYSGILHAEDQAMGRAREGNARSRLRARGAVTTVHARAMQSIALGMLWRA